MAATASWALVDNGLDFLRRAINEMAAEPPDNKYAIIHLFSAVEVLIKARLMREHWTLACTKVDGSTIAGLTNGDVHTVDAATGIDRLRTTVGLNISKDQADRVEGLRKFRNRAAHFAIVGNTDIAVRGALARGLDFTVWFLETHIRPDAPLSEATLIDNALEELAPVLQELKAYVAERLATIKTKLAKFSTLLRCPNCLQPALTLSEGEAPKCLLCWWQEEGEASANSYVYNVLNESEYVVVKDGGIWPVHDCPNCEDSAFVSGVELINNRTTPLNSTYAFACFTCSFEATAGEVEQCTRCGDWIISSEMSICGTCAQNLFESD